MRFVSYLALFATIAAPVAATAQDVAMAQGAECPSYEPDSLQISWTKPCEEGDWLLDTQKGCRMWDWHPDLHDRAVWSGACPGGSKEGRGTVQWYEHGQAIDRFEGTYHHNRREGYGRYRWNATDSYEGTYVNDVPQGQGTARIEGEVFAGDWQNGCFRKGGHVVAIGVSRKSCGELSAAADRPRQSGTD